ncbi:porin [Sodalis sp. CWE]|uniref:porin n=1 Tax=Sodalis sp. CWE TaxID=2803816 RepID=UPI001C7DDBFB|nr:porin [Sodalis sp. CWE]MBX4180994.1 porin [Sodalis sp. CWE]
MKLFWYRLVVISAMAIAGSIEATEIYNRGGNKIDLFGKFNGGRYMSGSNAGDCSFFLYGLSGEAQLGEGFTGFGVLEQGFKLNPIEGEGKSKSTRLGLVGMKFNDTVSIDYGRNYGILHDIGSWTSIMPTINNVTATATDNFIIGSSSGVLTYRNNNFFGTTDGLNFALQYQGKNDLIKNKEKQEVHEANGDGYGMSITYDLWNGMSIGAAYSSSNRALEQRLLKNNKKAEGYSLGLKYDADNLYLAALYLETHNAVLYNKTVDSKEKKQDFAKKTHNIELVARYDFDFGLHPSIGYLQSTINRNYQSNRQDMKKYIGMGASYNFSKNALTFVDYRINLLSKNSFVQDTKLPTNNTIAVGMTYTF